MHFLAKIGKKLIDNQIKNKAKKSGKPNVNNPIMLPMILFGGFGGFFIILIVLFVAVVVYITMAPIEGVVNFFKGVGDAVGGFFEKIGNWFKYGEFSNDETTYYKQLKDEYDNWKKKGVTIDFLWIASATNYLRGAVLSDSG